VRSGDQLTSAWEVKLDAWTVEVTQHVSHQGRGCVRHRRPLQREADHVEWGDQGRSGAIRVHSVVIRGDQTCSRKQIMSSQLRMKGSVTRSSSRIFSNGPLSFSGPPALRSTLSSAGM
jgi:hypothetical protein